MRILYTIATAVLLLVACSTKAPSNDVVDTFVDDYQRHVAVPAEPQRVVSLSPAVTEIIYALGAEELLVGRTDFCAYPPEVEQIPSIGGISNLNIERILAMHPDLIISGSMVGQKATEQMDRMGTPMVCVIEKPQFEGLYDNIIAIGRLVNRQAEADSLIATVTERLKSVDTSTAAAGSQRPTVYYVVGFGPSGNFTAGGNTFINDIITMAGGSNIAAEVTGWSYSLEALVDADPDYVIVRREDSAAFCNARPYNQLHAVRNKHVIGVESGMMDLQVPRNIDAINYLKKRMQR